MDFRQLKKIMKEFEASSLSKIEIQEKDFTVKMEKDVFSKSSINVLHEQKPLQVEEDSKNIQIDLKKYFTIKAPLVGTFYASSSPDSAPFVSINQRVEKGDVLFIIEAMKVMNEIKTPVSGRIKRINVNNGEMVEYSQVIMEIEE